MRTRFRWQTSMLEIPTRYLDSTWRHFDFTEIFDHDFDDIMASTNNEDGIKEMKNKLECNPEPRTSQMSTFSLSS